MRGRTLKQAKLSGNNLRTGGIPSRAPAGPRGNVEEEPMGGTREEILKVIREVVAPLIRADGGRVYLVAAEDDAVDLHLAGRFAGCPGNTLATRRVIEPA